MVPKKRLQVFVSSTYTDLREERQAAVEAILTAGHIPAGMELFAAGDQSQLELIHDWIDESDVYMLLLGGRYGTIEPTSGKSYTHLEYEYALSKEKPLFAVVVIESCLDELVKQRGRMMLESEYPQRLKEFRRLVESRIVRFWGDVKDIKLAVHESLGVFARRHVLRGWVPGDQAVGSGVIAEQMAALTRENSELRARLADALRQLDTTKYAGLSFAQLYSLLSDEQYPERYLDEEFLDACTEFGDPVPSLIHVFWATRHRFLRAGGIEIRRNSTGTDNFTRLAGFGLVMRDDAPGDEEAEIYRLTPDGRAFLLRLMVERGTPVG